MKTIHQGENLRLARRGKGITQEEMAGLIDLSQTTYSRIEKKSVITDRNLLLEVAQVLGMEPNELAPNVESDLAQVERAFSRFKNRGNLSRFVDMLCTRFILILIIMTLVATVYDATKAFCVANGMPLRLVFTISATVALITLIVMIFNAKKIKVLLRCFVQK